MSDDSRPGPIMLSCSLARHITVTMPLSTLGHEWLKTIRSAYSDEELKFFMSVHSRETEKSYGNYELKLANLNRFSPQQDLRSQILFVLSFRLLSTSDCFEFNEKFLFIISQNSCGTTPCKNGGTCQSGFLPHGYRCLCAAGFTGLKCETGEMFERNWITPSEIQVTLFSP